MLRKLTVHNFKSLRDVTVELPRLSILFGVNASGKSNLLDAIQALSWMADMPTLFHALGGPVPVRSYAFEAFSWPSGGLPALFEQQSARFALEADLVMGKTQYRYRIEPEIHFEPGRLSVSDEYLARLGARGSPKGNAAIERVGDKFHIRRKGMSSAPRQEAAGQNHSLLSDRSLSGRGYEWLDQVRDEFRRWRTYYLEPRTAMRAGQAPADVHDIGVQGECIAPFLFKLQAEYPKYFEAVVRILRSIVPDAENLTVDLDARRGTLDLQVRQGGVDYSSRILSEGTLRVLALCAIAVNPWGGSLIAFEEPENGVHPRRVELIAQLLLSLVSQENRQIIVTTHSPLFCDAILTYGEEWLDDIGLFNVRYRDQATLIEPLNPKGPLFRDTEIADLLARDTDNGQFGELLFRGLLDV